MIDFNIEYVYFFDDNLLYEVIFVLSILFWYIYILIFCEFVKNLDWIEYIFIIGKGRDGERDRRYNKGCNCKRLGCLKNYCECYEVIIYFFLIIFVLVLFIK